MPIGRPADAPPAEAPRVDAEAEVAVASAGAAGAPGPVAAVEVADAADPAEDRGAAVRRPSF